MCGLCGFSVDSSYRWEWTLVFSGFHIGVDIKLHSFSLPSNTLLYTDHTLLSAHLGVDGHILFIRVFLKDLFI